jgi:hypothetical protein
MTNTTNHAPAGIDLDKLEALARAATPGPWEKSFGRYDVIAPSESNAGLDLYHVCDTSGRNYPRRSCNADFIAAANPATVLALIALARRAAADAPAADEREAFEAWFAREFPLQNSVDMRFKRDGDQYFSCFVQDRWDGWKARAAHPIGQVSPAIDQAAAPTADGYRWRDCDECGGSGRISPSELCARCERSGILPAPVCHAPADAVSPSDATGKAIPVCGCGHDMSVCVVTSCDKGIELVDAPGKADAASAGGLSTLPEPENYQAIIDAAEGDGEHGATSAADAKTADCHESCGYVGAECDFPHCKSNGAADAMDAEQTQAARDVLDERRRQVEAEGWTPEHDDQYTACELARAAATYATCSHIEQLRLCGEQVWPWHPDWWKRGDYRRDLVKSGALILAEIERVDRDRAAIAASQQGGQHD